MGAGEHRTRDTNLFDLIPDRPGRHRALIMTPWSRALDHAAITYRKRKARQSGTPWLSVEPRAGRGEHRGARRPPRLLDVDVTAPMRSALASGTRDVVSGYVQEVAS